MKILIWAITATVAIFGTLTVLVLASGIGWMADNMTNNADWVKQIAQWPTPAWLSPWFDATALEPIRAAIASGLHALANSLPWLAPMLGWLVPVMWVLWTLALLCLLAVALGLHYWVGRSRKPAIA